MHDNTHKTRALVDWGANGGIGKSYKMKSESKFPQHLATQYS
jgi:hypothetical protein